MQGNNHDETIATVVMLVASLAIALAISLSVVLEEKEKMNNMEVTAKQVIVDGI